MSQLYKVRLLVLTQIAANSLDEAAAFANDDAEESGYVVLHVEKPEQIIPKGRWVATTEEDIFP